MEDIENQYRQKDNDSNDYGLAHNGSVLVFTAKLLFFWRSHNYIPANHALVISIRLVGSAAEPRLSALPDGPGVQLPQLASEHLFPLLLCAGHNRTLQLPQAAPSQKLDDRGGGPGNPGYYGLDGRQQRLSSHGSPHRLLCTVNKHTAAIPFLPPQRVPAASAYHFTAAPDSFREHLQLEPCPLV